MSDDFEQQSALWDRWAPTYDGDSVALATTVVVDALWGLAGPGGSALELGIGTGRIAMPLAQRGIRVEGLEASTAMADQLIERRGDLPVRVRIGDMADFETAERFDVVYVVASTFFLLLTQERQIACLSNSARALAPGGCLVLESSVPGTSALPLGRQQNVVREVGPAHLKMSIIEHDPLTQIMFSQEIRWQADGQYRMLPMRRRYVHLAELDLMAQIVGLNLTGRYCGWDLQQPYSAGEPRQVSLYRRGSKPG
jgi:SAM-dependent methyltransferase